MSYVKLDFFERLQNAKDSTEICNIINAIYVHGLDNGYTEGQACHIFLSGLRNINFNSYFDLWLNDKDETKNKNEYYYLCLLLLCAGLGFCFLKNSLLLEHRKTLSIGLAEKCETLGIDLQKLSFECVKILTNKQLDSRKIFDGEINLDIRKILLNNSHIIVRTILLNIVQRRTLVAAIRKIKKKMENSKIRIPYIFETIFGCLSEMNKCLNYAETRNLDLSKVTVIFSDEIIVMKLLILVTSGIQEIPNRIDNKDLFFTMLDDIYDKKINSFSDEIWNQIDNLKSRIPLFSNSELTQEYFAFCEKILIITIKWLIVVQNIQQAKDSIWKRKTFIRESHEWYNNLESIINRFINEDWESMQKLLEEENSQVEWKGSISTPLEIKMADGEFKKNNLKKIAETIISMMNSEGGNIIIGYIENYNKVRDDVKVDCYMKGMYHFFDIQKDLERNNYSLDKFIRDIEDIIKNDIKTEIDEFSKYIAVEKIYLTDEKDKFVGNIIVTKSDRVFFLRGDNHAVLLKKRMGRRNEYADPLLEIISI